MGRKAGVRTPYTLWRDEKIIDLLAEGKTQLEIADHLHLSEFTVCQLIKAMMKSRKAKTKVHLVAMKLKAV